MNKYNIAFLGGGKIAIEVAKTVMNLGRYNLYGVASRRRSTAENFASKFNNLCVFDTYEDLLKDDMVDLIYISTPTKLHYENIKDCLLANKDVICEKPICEYLWQLEELMEIAKSKKLLLLDGLWSQYMPIIEDLKSMIKEIGCVHFGYACLGYPSVKTSNGELVCKYDIWDYEVYPISILMRLFGMPVETKTYMRTKKNVEVVKKRVMIYKDMKCVTRASLLHRGSDLLFIRGGKGMIICRRYWFGNHSVFVYKWPFSFRKYHRNHRISGYEHEFEEFALCLDKREQSEKYPLEQAISYLKIKEMN